MIEQHVEVTTKYGRQPCFAVCPDAPGPFPARKIKGEMYIGFAEVDPSVPDHVLPALKSALEKAGTRHTVETIGGTHHGYCFAARADYNAVAAEATWEKLFALWDRNLR